MSDGLDERLYDLAHSLLDCTANALRPDVPENRYVLPGADLAWDCCKSGQLAVNLLTSYPSRSFPNVDLTTSPCDVPYTVQIFGITLLRCIPVGTANRGPTVASLEASGRAGMRDVELIQSALYCCLNDRDAYGALIGPTYKWLLGNLQTLGPEGGCAGFQQQVIVGVPACRGCC